MLSVRPPPPRGFLIPPPPPSRSGLLGELCVLSRGVLPKKTSLQRHDHSCCVWLFPALPAGCTPFVKRYCQF